MEKTVEILCECGKLFGHIVFNVSQVRRGRLVALVFECLGHGEMEEVEDGKRRSVGAETRPLFGGGDSSEVSEVT